MKTKLIILLAVLLFIETIIMGFVLYQYNQGFFIKQYFDERNGNSKVSYYLGSVKLWDEISKPLGTNDVDNWALVHVRGRINTLNDEKSFMYWQFLSYCDVFLSAEESKKVKNNYIELLNKDKKKAYEYVDKIMSQYRNMLLNYKTSTKSPSDK